MRFTSFNLPLIKASLFPNLITNELISYFPPDTNLEKASASSKGETSFLCKFSVMAYSSASSSDNSLIHAGMFSIPAIKDARKRLSPHTIS